jgi:hypothetical protein
MMFCLALQMNSKLRGKLGALPLPEGERVGVRGYDPSRGPIPLTRRATRVDLSPAGRGGTRGSRESFLQAQGSFES